LRYSTIPLVSHLDLHPSLIARVEGPRPDRIDAVVVGGHTML
jgi:hypothetical protein